MILYIFSCRMIVCLLPERRKPDVAICLNPPYNGCVCFLFRHYAKKEKPLYEKN